MSAWSRQQDLAQVESPGRRVLLDLTRLHQAPVLLEGAALEVFDAVDGTRDTDDITALLSAQHPEVPDLAEQVGSCLATLEELALIRREPSADL